MIDAASKEGSLTALHAAAKAGHAHVIRLLVEAGADALVVDSDLQVRDAARHCHCQQHHRQLTSSAAPLQTPLHLVAAAGHGMCVKALLDAGSDPSAKNMASKARAQIFGAILGSIYAVQIPRNSRFDRLTSLLARADGARLGRGGTAHGRAADDEARARATRGERQQRRGAPTRQIAARAHVWLL